MNEVPDSRRSQQLPPGMLNTHVQAAIGEASLLVVLASCFCLLRLLLLDWALLAFGEEIIR